MSTSGTRPNRWGFLLLIVTAALVIAIDQTSKYIVSQTLDLYQEWAPIPALQRIFVITHITNTGAAFGIFPQGSAVFTIVGIVVPVVILIYSWQLVTHQRLFQLGLGLQMGGALGNLIDRLVRGHVIDFLYLKFWPVSNVSDICIVAGVAMIAFVLLTESRSEKKESADNDPESSEQNLSAAP